MELLHPFAVKAQCYYSTNPLRLLYIPSLPSWVSFDCAHLCATKPNKGSTACFTGTDSAHLQDQVAVKVEEYQEMLRWDV
jgi:hypothetical protein